MRGKFVAVTVLALSGAVGLIGGAGAVVGDADTTVTIKAEGLDLSGVVKSPNPQVCANNRNVVVFKQVGARGGGDDQRFAMDTASLSGNVYAWSTGQTGTPGRFYSRVHHIPGCKADLSPTIRAQR